MILAAHGQHANEREPGRDVGRMAAHGLIGELRGRVQLTAPLVQIDQLEQRRKRVRLEPERLGECAPGTFGIVRRDEHTSKGQLRLRGAGIGVDRLFGALERQVRAPVGQQQPRLGRERERIPRLAHEDVIDDLMGLRAVPRGELHERDARARGDELLRVGRELVQRPHGVVEALLRRVVVGQRRGRALLFGQRDDGFQVRLGLGRGSVST